LFVSSQQLLPEIYGIYNKFVKKNNKGELQKKLDQWHSMGMDEREIAIRSKDEQLKSKIDRLSSLNS
jgi:hypothetical protein